MLWTHEKRDILRDLVMKGYNLAEIEKNIPFPEKIGKHSFSNAIKRYTTRQERNQGRFYRREIQKAQMRERIQIRKLQRYQKDKDTPLRAIPPTLLAKMTEEQQEQALFGLNTLPAFHPLSYSPLPPLPLPEQQEAEEILNDSALMRFLDASS